MPTAKLTDIALHYETSGEGEPLLLIHGLGSSCRDWEHQVPCLSDLYRVVAPDLRGYGNSDKPSGPYSISQFANDIAELITTLNLGPTHVVGISLGGFVASQLAVDHGELVRSLVVVNSAPELPRDTLMARLRTRRDLLLRRLIVRVFGMRTMGRILSKKLFPQAEQARLRQTFVERWAENDRRVYSSTLAALSDWSVKDRLGSIACPTCVVSGQEDFFPMGLKEEYLARISDSKLVVVPDSGHLTPVDQPEQFNDAVMSFLAEQE